MTRSRPSALSTRGYARVRGALGARLLDRLRAALSERYAEVERIRSEGPPPAAFDRLRPVAGFAPTASSFELDAALAPRERDDVLQAIVAGPAGRMLARFLGERLLVALDQSWVRRQYAPARYPALHSPHGWHQDGALGFDFAALAEAAPPADGLLDMVTCWIALTPCGRDAPGLELVARGTGEMAAVAELTDGRLRARFDGAAFERPVLEAGDALVFPGGTIHRTHVEPSMRHDRTSLELRFFAGGEAPGRLRHHRFAALRLASRVP